MVLQSPIFNGFRIATFERALSNQIDFDVVVDGSVRVRPGRELVFEVTDASLPSPSLPEVDFVQLDRMSLRINTANLMVGEYGFYGLIIDGLEVNLIKEEDGRASWSGEDAGVTQAVAETPDSETELQATMSATVGSAFRAKSLLNFVLERSDSLTSVHVRVDNRSSGFDFDFELGEMAFERSGDDSQIRLASSGTVNGQRFEYAGAYDKLPGAFSRVGPFETRVEFGDTSFVFAGENYGEDKGGGYDGTIEFNIGQIGDLLEVLKLERSLEGTGRLTADISETNGIVSLQNLETVLDKRAGAQFTASGKIDNLKAVDGADINVGLRLFPEGQPPPPAVELSDFKVMNISARIAGEDDKLTIEDAVLTTNIFITALHEFGPISIEHLKRTDEGKIALSGILAQAGPLDDPYLRITGSMEDTLSLASYAFDGTIFVPARAWLEEVSAETAQPFGAVRGAFRIDDSAGFRRLTKLDLGTVDTDLWALVVKAESGADAAVQNLEVEFGLDIEDGSSFFSALGLNPVDLSPLSLKVAADLSFEAVKTQIETEIGASDLSFEFLLDKPDAALDLTGGIVSEELRLADLRAFLDGVGELKKLRRLPTAEKVETAAPSSDVAVQPLVLPADPEPSPSLSDEPPEEREVQPLVLPKETPSQPDQPKVADLLNPQILLGYMDVDLGIDIKKLSGVTGVTSIESTLTASDGQAQLTPIRFQYGEGVFDAQATLDVLNAPDRVAVSGSMGGWDLGQVFSEFGVSLNAAGTLNGSFDISARYAGAQEFVNSMRGRVSLGLSEGYIATSLLELAGLGVFPWLFSEERREGRTDIVCLVVPVQIDGAALSFDQAVVETPRVQLVASGGLNWREDTIDIRAEPRPVGEPLSRGAFPFEVTGKISEPDFRLQKGGKRVPHADGADSMPAERTPCVPDIAQLQSN